jgi:SseB protein C-terminal domain
MKPSVEPDRTPREFVAAQMPAAVVGAVEALVRSRPEVREAHLVSMRLSRAARPALTLVVVSDDPDITTTLASDLRRILKPHVRPEVVVLTEADDDLVHVRGLGGELKRGEKRFPWWILFIG